MNSLEIKRLSKNDLALAQLAVQLFLDEGETVTNDNELMTLLAKEDFYFVVATINREIVGRLVAYEFGLYKNNTREVYLYEVDVLDAYQNSGIGTSLVNFTKQICETRGVSYMFVGTEEVNTAAQKLYIKTGGKLEGNMPHYEYEF